MCGARESAQVSNAMVTPNMLVVVLYSLLFAGTVVWSEIVEGRWIIDNIQECPDPEQYPNPIEVKKQKHDRKDYSYTVSLKLREEINREDYGVVAEIYKKCDGGYKFQQFWNATSYCDLVNQFAKKNFERFLEGAGVDPPNCPIPERDIEVKDYMIDYDELPPKGVEGEFRTYAFLVKKDEKLFCLEVDARFQEHNDDDDDDEDCDD